MVIKASRLKGSWSAAPTPFTDSVKIDTVAVKRMVRHHIKTGQRGIFLGGTCGEGPFMPRKDLLKLASIAAVENQYRMTIAAQATDNSYARVLENIRNLKKEGIDIAVVAEPWFLAPFVREEAVEEYYLKAIEGSPLPVCIYVRGDAIPWKIIKKVAAHPNVCMVKDSAGSDRARELMIEVRRQRKGIVLLTGCELNLLPYLKSGYDGTLSGGGILIGKLTVKMLEEARKGNFGALAVLQRHCNRINYAAYGGKKIKSWLTGLKYTLVQLGIFRTTAGYLKYPLPKSVGERIVKMIKREREHIMP
jgi:dihydrodipicolinate synthase/N-acetylneuraminate lyase